MDAQQQTFSLDELSTLSGCSVRTIRYYIQQRLVDRPEGQNKGAHYTTQHLSQLTMIQKWRAEGVSLDRIRELLSGKDSGLPPRLRRPGSVRIVSHVCIAPGLELTIDSEEARLDTQTVQALLQEIGSLVRRLQSSVAENQHATETTGESR